MPVDARLAPSRVKGQLPRRIRQHPCSSCALLCAVAQPARGLTVIVAPTIDTAIVAGPADGATIEDERPTFAFAATRDGEPFPGATFHCSVDNAPPSPARARSCSARSKRAPTPSPSTRRTPALHRRPRAGPPHRSRSSKKRTNAKSSKTKKASMEEECDEEEVASPFPPEECMLRTARARLFTYCRRRTG